MRFQPGRCIVTALLSFLISISVIAGESAAHDGWQFVDGSAIPADAKFVPPTEKVSGKFNPPDLPGRVSASAQVVAIVGLNGGVAAVQVESERPELIPAALAAAETSKYDPATLDGKPVAVRFVYRYTYNKE